MNNLELKIHNFKPAWDPDKSFELVEIYIDGKNLIEIVEDFEKRKGFDDAPGSYVGNFPESLARELESNNGDGIEVLISAGSLVTDDWSIKMDCNTRDGIVTWYNFRQPWRNDSNKVNDFWDYAEFPKFEFSEKQYRSELKKLDSFYKKNTN